MFYNKQFSLRCCLLFDSRLKLAYCITCIEYVESICFIVCDRVFLKPQYLNSLEQSICLLLSYTRMRYFLSVME